MEALQQGVENILANNSPLEIIVAFLGLVFVVTFLMVVIYKTMVVRAEVKGLIEQKLGYKVSDREAGEYLRYVRSEIARKQNNRS